MGRAIVRHQQRRLVHVGWNSYAASNYRYWISGIGNPEQFDAAIDSTAYTDDIKDDGGPLVACAVLRDFVVCSRSLASMS